MERPGIVWVYSLFVFLGIILSVVGNFAVITKPLAQTLSPVAFYAAIISMILVIPQAIFIYLFFMLKKSSLTWLYITFGGGILLSAIAQQWLSVVILAVFGWAVWDYITKKKAKDGQPIFT